MERQIRDRRRIEISIFGFQKEKGRHPGRQPTSPVGTYLYDRAGRYLETLQGDSPEEALDELLSALCRGQPEVSGTEWETLTWKGQELSLRIRRYIHMTLGEMADFQAYALPDYEAVADHSRHVRLTYMEVKEYSDSLAKALIAMGVEKGDHVAVIMDNCWENVITKIAVEKTGGVIVNLNIHEKAFMMKKLLCQADVKVIILRQGIRNREHMKLLYEMCPELRFSRPGQIASASMPTLRHLIVTDRGRWEPCAWQFEELLDRGRGIDHRILKERMDSITPFDDATIIHTSGTSGEPKGVLLAHGQLMENAWSHVQVMGLTCEDRLCMTSPMFHSLGCVGCALTTEMAGGTLICFDRLESAQLLELIREERCTVFCSVPTIFIRLIGLVRQSGTEHEMKSLRLCVTAGAPCPKQTLTDMKHVLGASHVLTMYGMTEAGPGITSTRLEDPVETVVSTVGRLWPGVGCQIRDLETGRILEPGETGEICVSSYGVMKRYYNNPEETRKAVDQDGWLHTGDIGFLREDENLVLQGRCKDLIIRGGENISPREVEEFLCGHEAVLEAAVVGAPDEQYGEKVFAFVRLKPGMKLEKEELTRWCRGKIATIKIPQEIEFVDKFPVSDTGKTVKGLLRQQAANRKSELDIGDGIKRKDGLVHGKNNINTGGG